MPAPDYSTTRRRWNAVMRRDRDADGHFVYAVVTTGVCCRPSCASRKPLPKNVEYYATCQAAVRAGYRPCRRCRPQDSAAPPAMARLIAACRLLETSDEAPTCRAVAERIGLNPHYFQRLFKKRLGVTPHAYRQRVLAERSKQLLAQGKSVTSAAIGAGYSSSSRFYESAARELGMTPRTARRGAPGETVCYAIADSTLGAVLIAWTGRGVCEVQFCDDEAEGVAQLSRRFPRAQFERVEQHPWIDAVLRVVNVQQANHRRDRDLPLDIRGTAFQQRVWRQLRTIPPGTTRTYTELAAELGVPKAVRAVASAVAANRLAVIVPCHRVIRQDGSLAGYRWGLERKQLMLERESAATSESSTSDRESRP